MQMRVSVIIPVFNEESTITRVLEEVLAVDLGAHEVEVLVADDGSSDGTLDLLRPLVAEHDAIRLLEHPWPPPVAMSSSSRMRTTNTRLPTFPLYSSPSPTPTPTPSTAAVFWHGPGQPG
jgi:cellulose synthase/poly-beta-1,6-N-acetylglucosamine synthase-like glycosyltransferase